MRERDHFVISITRHRLSAGNGIDHGFFGGLNSGFEDRIHVVVRSHRDVC